jgi:hypothetical protein
MVKMFTRGRLGNVLFQLATGWTYAKDHDMLFTLNDTTKDPVMQPLYFQNLVNKNWDESKPSKFIREMQHNYAPIPWEEDWRNYNVQFITGYYQSEKYFKHRRKEILELFNIPYSPLNMVSIHVRRGDYLTIPGKHINFNDEYFEKAYDFFHNQHGCDSFLVFSDDIEWCKKYFGDKGYHFSYSSASPLMDLSLMSSCKHHINSSSTFSWWGSWLTHDPESIVITPKEWFQWSQSENTEDIIPEGWIKL